ncbi:membrane-bound lytic murein transglycosylase MltF [Neptunomonas phycophila]|uniref:membrane-bound lytic murein transglycosylase MltF n=1 Tax=Neptunomonas phycophila TaxID=1572645 RepID=UPI0023F84AD7|nr:membrane-bound lytic murein transglycosylase MltF [Neptunomonas phycophila]
MLFSLKKRTLKKRIDVLHLLTLIVILSLPALVSYNAKSQLQVIQDKGVLRVATRNTPNSYFIDTDGPAGFEYELAQAYANYLDVTLDIIVPNDIKGLFEAVENRDAHIAAAGITVSDIRESKYDFSRPYSESASTVIYRVRQGVPAPVSVEDLIGKKVLILANSIQAEQLNRLKESFPELAWEATDELTNTDILDKVFNEEVDYAIVDSTVYESQSSFYPGLSDAFVIGRTRPIAWVLTHNQDGSIKKSVDKFLGLESTKVLITELKAKYFSKENPLNFFDTVTFKSDLETRLPALEPYFKEAAIRYDFDWKFLAAIAYQESHWRADAVSPTGVKGIMMLTQAAAKEVGVEDRTDPVESIFGGAQYLINVKAKIPERIKDPDHTWFALAGYNIGFGHLEDARILTQRADKDPDKWEDVKEFLPLLSKQRYYQTVKYGYARGQEPVQYVENIQKYMDLLEWEKQIQEIREAREEAMRAIQDAENQSAPNGIILLDNMPDTL